MTGLRLRPVRPADEAEVTAAQLAMAPEDFLFCFRSAGQSWRDYLAEVEQQRIGRDLPADRVPATFLLAESAGTIVGRASIRHTLDDWLLAHGGHIGYCVLPGFRRRGHATEILRQSLIVARSLGVDRVLVTCDDDNLGSIAVIESAGGRLDPGWPTETHDGVLGRRYWID